MKSQLCSYSRILAIGLVALFIQGAFAHTYVSSVVLGGTALAEGDCVRPHPSSGYDNPITLVSSVNMTCGFLPQAAEPANRACPITAGSTLGIQWHHNNDLPTDDILDSSHKGPIIFYLAKSSDGEGDVWFKIWEQGYDSTTDTWATDDMIAADGLSTITIPSDIAPGNYLLRGEVLALHQAYELNGVQPYVGCVELTIAGSGTSDPSATGVAFPGAYSNTDPGILINIYTTFPLPYPIPGPALYVSGTASAPSTTSTASAPTSAPSNPTSSPSGPTSAPSNPTSAPTSAPQSTPAPAGPTSAPSGGSGGSLTVQMNQGSSTWWMGVIVSGGSEATAKVEIMDSGDVTSWTALDALSYAYVFDENMQLTLPISVRLTSTSGAQVTLSDVFTSWAATPINTGENYGSSSSSASKPATPTAAPSTPTTPAAPVNPANPATPAPVVTSAPSATSSAPSGVSVTVYQSSNVWWFAVTVSGMDSVASVEMKDSGALTSYALMTTNAWGYSLSTEGEAFVTPLTVRVTNEAGQSVTATVSSITPGDVLAASA